VAGGEEPVPDLQEHRLEDLRQQRAARLVRSQDHLFTDSYHCVFWPEGFCVHLQYQNWSWFENKTKKSSKLVLPVSCVVRQIIPGISLSAFDQIFMHSWLV
jgi:hypothetical protein